MPRQIGKNTLIYRNMSITKYPGTSGTSGGSLDPSQLINQFVDDANRIAVGQITHDNINDVLVIITDKGEVEVAVTPVI